MKMKILAIWKVLLSAVIPANPGGKKVAFEKEQNRKSCYI